MNIAKIVTKVIRELPKLEGSSTRTVLRGKKAKEMLSEMVRAKDIPDALKAKIRAIKDPVIEWSGKCKKQYSIAGMRLKDGDNVLLTGATSVAGKGEKAIIKEKLSLGEHWTEEGKAHYDVLASSHVQCVKKVNPELDITLSNRGTTIKGKFANNTMGANVELDKKFMEQFPEFKVGYNKFISGFSKGANKAMSKIREIITGKYKSPEDKKMEEALASMKSEFKEIKSPELNSAEIKKALEKKMETENSELKAHLTRESSKAIKELQSKFKKKS